MDRHHIDPVQVPAAVTWPAAASGGRRAGSPSPRAPTTHRHGRRPAESNDGWEGALGMPFVFEQLNLDRPQESHLYFDPGDGRLITICTKEGRPGRHDEHLDRARSRSNTLWSRGRRRRSRRPSSDSTSAQSSTAA